jgi:large subunit ribosomal protein L3
MSDETMAMLLGKKVGMTQVYDESGKLLGVTVIQAGPCSVMQVKTAKTDGYSAVQLGFEDIKQSRRKNSQVGHAKKAKTAPKKFVREMRLADEAEVDYKVGESITVSAFAEDKYVDVVGTSKGKGFAGVQPPSYYEEP